MKSSVTYLTKQWIMYHKCFKSNGDIDYEKIRRIMRGKKFSINILSFLKSEHNPNRNHTDKYCSQKTVDI